MTRKRHTELSETPKVHSELQGFELRLNSLGEIECTVSDSEINEFLSRHVFDKKLQNELAQAQDYSV
ncbi:MAG: hypothetical protein WD077_03365 [Bacteroidia bacterium]